MAKKEYDFMKLIEKKGNSGKFVDRIQEEYNTLIREEITRTIDDYQAAGTTLAEAEDDPKNKWLNMMVYSLIYSSSAFTTFKSQIRNVLEPNEYGKFIRDFSAKTDLKLRYNTTGSLSRGSESIAMTLELIHNGPDAENIARALNVALNGGEFHLGDEDKAIVLNARPGYAEERFEAAADMMRDYFKNEFNKKMNKSLKAEIEKELKKLTK